MKIELGNRQLDHLYILVRLRVEAIEDYEDHQAEECKAEYAALIGVLEQLQAARESRAAKPSAALCRSCLGVDGGHFPGCGDGYNGNEDQRGGG